MSTQKSLPLTKEEVMQLLDHIQAHPVLISKATNARNNQLKEATWVKITKNFNSLITSCPRKPEQLRLKWENLKKVARKRLLLKKSARMNNLKTGDGKPEYFPLDKTLDKVAEILDPTSHAYTHTRLPVTGKTKRRAVADDIKASVIKRNSAVAEYFNAKKQNEEVLAELNKRKLELEILKLEKEVVNTEIQE